MIQNSQPPYLHLAHVVFESLTGPTYNCLLELNATERALIRLQDEYEQGPFSRALLLYLKTNPRLVSKVKGVYWSTLTSGKVTPKNGKSSKPRRRYHHHAGPLTRDMVYFFAKDKNNLAYYQEFERRRLLLNKAHSLLVNLLSRSYRSFNLSAPLPSMPRAVAATPPDSVPLDDLPPFAPDFIHAAWRFSIRFARAVHELSEFVDARNEDSALHHLQLRFDLGDLTHRASAYWILHPSGKRITMSTQRRPLLNIPDEAWPHVEAIELERRRLVHDVTELHKKLLNFTGPADATVDASQNLRAQARRRPLPGQSADPPPTPSAPPQDPPDHHSFGDTDHACA